MPKTISKYFKFRLEIMCYYFVTILLKLVPKSKRPHLIGGLLASVGPKVGVSKRIRRNLKVAFPDLSEAKAQSITKEVWRNLGIVYAEMSIGKELVQPDTGIVAQENFAAYDKARQGNRGAIMIGAHFGNWELSVLYAGLVLNNFTGFYRLQNNPFINAKINKMRTSTGSTLIAKNDRGGLKKAIKNLKQGGSVGILMDQRMHAGPEIPFLGTPATTMPLVFSLAQTTGAAVIPYRLKRQADGTYVSIFEDEVKMPDTGNRQEDRTIFLTEINRIFGEWVKEDPEQWFWFHNRWVK